MHIGFEPFMEAMLPAAMPADARRQYLAQHAAKPLSIPINPADRLYPLKDGDEVFRIKAEARKSKFQPKFDLTFEIAFGEGQIVDGEPLVPSLRQLIDFTKRIVEIFERRLFTAAA